MTDHFDEQIEELKQAPPRLGMNERIMLAVRREARRQQVVFYLLEAGLASAVAASFLSVRLLLGDLSVSHLGQLLGLVLTDGREILSFFSDWFLAVMEATPVGSLSLALGTVFISIFLLDKLVRAADFRIRMTKRAV